MPSFGDSIRSIDFKNPAVIMWTLIAVAILSMIIARAATARMKHTLDANNVECFLRSNRIFQVASYTCAAASFGLFVVQMIVPDGYAIPLNGLFIVNMVLAISLVQAAKRIRQAVRRAETEGVFADVFLHRIKNAEDHLNAMLSVSALSALVIGGNTIDWKGAKAALMSK